MRHIRKVRLALVAAGDGFPSHDATHAKNHIVIVIVSEGHFPKHATNNQRDCYRTSTVGES